MTHPKELRRIFSISAHIDHGKSTTADYLLAKAGLMSAEAAGEKRMTDSDEEEQERGITIFTTVVILSYEYVTKDADGNEKEETYLFQINDTPGHLSFTGEVSRALRGSDGAVILVDALEGMMTQTETNIQLSVGEERCKPVLFINKVDRLISELRLDPEDVFGKLDIIVSQINNLIKKLAPEGLKKEWAISFAKNSIAVGSAKDGWAFTVEILKQKGLKPADVFRKYDEDDKEWLRENLPLDDALLRMVIQHIPEKNQKLVRHYGAYSRRKKSGIKSSTTKSVSEGRVCYCPRCYERMEFVFYSRKDVPPDRNNLVNWLENPQLS